MTECESNEPRTAPDVIATMLKGEYYTDYDQSSADLGVLRALVVKCDTLKAKLESLGPIAPLLPRAVVEAEKAMQKFPQPNYVISKWAEETGEVTKAMIHHAEGRETTENLVGEIVQSLAMLHRLMIEGDEIHGLDSICTLMAKETS